MSIQWELDGVVVNEIYEKQNKRSGTLPFKTQGRRFTEDEFS